MDYQHRVKSTYAKQLINENPNSYKRINKDLLREMFDNNHHSKDAEKFYLKCKRPIDINGN